MARRRWKTETATAKAGRAVGRSGSDLFVDFFLVASGERRKRESVFFFFFRLRILSPHQCDGAHAGAAARRGRTGLHRSAHGLRKGHLGVKEEAAGRGRGKGKGSRSFEERIMKRKKIKDEGRQALSAQSSRLIAKERARLFSSFSVCSSSLCPTRQLLHSPTRGRRLRRRTRGTDFPRGEREQERGRRCRSRRPRSLFSLS